VVILSACLSVLICIDLVIAGQDLANLLHMPAEMADKTIMEWGVQNKYHRRRFLRKLNSSFRPVNAHQGAPSGDGQKEIQAQDQPQSLSAAQEHVEGSVEQKKQTRDPTEDHSSTAFCNLCEDDSIAAHTCDLCGLLCSECAASHLRMKKAFKNHLVTSL
jgi:hypothetical protein